MRNNQGLTTGGCLPANTQGKGRGERMMDLEVGAVDELLVGEQEEEEQGEKGKPTDGFPSGLSTLLFII